MNQNPFLSGKISTFSSNPESPKLSFFVEWVSSNKSEKTLIEFIFRQNQEINFKILNFGNVRLAKSQSLTKVEFRKAPLSASSERSKISSRIFRPLDKICSNV